MGNKTKIDWADSTWNPVTGCLHGCEYCYARRIAERFSCEGQTLDAPAELQRVWLQDGGADLRKNGCHVLRYPVRLKDSGMVCSYPFGFAPTFHRYLLNKPQQWSRKARTIFVCSMADLFGDWVPLEWIQEVFAACRKAPRHRYLFLTKNPDRYLSLANTGNLPNDHNFWYGTTVTDPDCDYFFSDQHNTFVSIEPIQSDFPTETLQAFRWAIIGAETGPRKDRVIPQRSWIEHVAQACDQRGAPVFMKSSVRELMGEDFRQEYPWEVNGHG